jgi:predicted RNase H-like nuclease (RuvC/YqgF family)
LLIEAPRQRRGLPVAMSSDPLEQAQQVGAQVVADSLAQDLERQYVALQQERSIQQGRLEQAEADLQRLRAENATLKDAQSQAVSLQGELTVAQAKAQALQETQTSSQERADRLQTEADLLRQELR